MFIKLTEKYKDSNLVDCKRTVYHNVDNIALIGDAYGEGCSVIWLKYPISDSCNFKVKESPEQIIQLIKEGENESRI